MPVVMVFGASGQDGHYLSASYRRRGWTVVPVSRSGAGEQADISDWSAVEDLVRRHKPDVLYHLAATSSTRHEAAFANHASIGSGTLNVLEAVHRHCRGCKVFLAGSGLQFRNVGDPIHESDPFDATSWYAVERISAAYAARYFRGMGIAAYVGFLFHHESPLRKASHVSQRVAQAARQLGAGSSARLEIGDVSVQKEWTFAGDVTDGMIALVEQDAIFEAVIGSGIAHTISDWLEVCFRLVGADWRDHTTITEGFVPEYPRLVSDPTTMHSLGWAPRVGFEELAAMMLAH